MRAKRPCSPKKVAAIRLTGYLRMSPHEFRSRIEADAPLPTDPLDYEDALDEDALDDDECPAFDDMDGEEDGDDSDEW